MLGQGAWEDHTKGMYMWKGEERGKNEEEEDRKGDGERKRLRSEGSLCACVNMQAQNLQGGPTG